MTRTSDERLRRWRLLLGSEEADGIGLSLVGADLAMDNCLNALYDADGRGGLSSRRSDRRVGWAISALIFHRRWCA